MHGQVTWDTVDRDRVLPALVAAAIGEAAVLLHPPLPSVGVSIGMERVWSAE